jgi:N-methylhydantoinase A
MTLEAAANAIMAVWSENMVQAISDITVNRGIDPAQAVIVGGGGAAGLNALTIAARLGCRQLIIPEVGAALSAFGAAVSDIAREYRRVFVTSTAQFDRDGAAAIVADLRRQALAFAQAANVDVKNVRIDFLVEARYLHQVWEIDVAIEPDRLFKAGGVDALTQAFHRAHEHIFAFSDPDSPIEVIAWRAAVRCAMATEATLTLARIATASPTPQWRRAFFPESGWLDVPVLEFSEIELNKKIDGPAIVESPFTSIVINGEASFVRSTSGNLVVTPGAVDAASNQAHASAKGGPGRKS